MTEDPKELVARLRSYSGGEDCSDHALEFVVPELRQAMSAAADLIDRLTADRERSAGEWQPIETAPRDGEYLGGRWDDGVWMTSVLRGYATKPFTHWHALPAAPAPALPETGVEG